MPRKLNKAKKPPGGSFLTRQRNKLIQQRLETKLKERENAAQEFAKVREKTSRLPPSAYQTTGSRSSGSLYSNPPYSTSSPKKYYPSITFREFWEIVEGKKKPYEPVDAVPGTYKVHDDGSEEFILTKYDPSEKKVKLKKWLKQRGGHGKKAIMKAAEKRERKQKNISEKRDIILKSGEDYGGDTYQKELRKKRDEKVQRRKKINDELYRERVHGFGTRSYSGGRSGWIKDGKFTPDEDT